jgi:putative membrane protein
MRSTSSVIAGVAATLSLGLGAWANQPGGATAQVHPVYAQTAPPVAQAPQRAPAPPVAQPPAPSQAITPIESLPQPDRDFVRQAMSANTTALRFGQLAAHRGESVEVRSLGREMVDTNTGLSDQFQQSANTVGVTLPAPAMTPDQTRMYTELAALSGKEFDKAFLRNVAKVQQETIASFENEAAKGDISEFALFANSTLPLLKQRAHTVQNQIHSM